ncbi:MAG: DegQ family serine endoprotease [Sedimentisphaerales bacterium]|nr:DegQ family serine endoprotease [Sedimentisphaerales bacterium]
MNSKKMRSGFCLLVFALSVFSLAPAVPAKTNELDALRQTSKAFSAVAKDAVPAVVFVKVEKTIETGSMRRPGSPDQYNDPFGFFGDEFFERFFRDRMPQQPREYRQSGQGSGFIISEDGYILTNNHVVGQADVISVKTHDGREFNAKLIGTDEKTDVAVIKIEGENLPTLPLGDSDHLDIGEWVIAIGNPFGLAETLTFGIVSAKGRSTVGIADYEDFIQTDAAINPGNSGGPLINLDGEVIGINTAIFSQSGGSVGIGFAIPINMAKHIKDQLVKEGKVTRGQLGVSISDLTSDVADYFGLDSTRGVVVNEVVEGSPAQKAGLEAGDVILKINDRDVESMGQLRNTIASMEPGTTVRMLVNRQGKEKTLPVKIGELSADSSRSVGSSVPSGTLGLTVQNITEDMSRRFGLRQAQGVIVSSVTPDSEAFRKGIRPGTIILSINQKEIRSVDEFNQALGESTTSKKVLLQISEQGYTRFVVLSLE